jgi:hypothetical protein
MNQEKLPKFMTHEPNVSKIEENVIRNCRNELNLL